VGVAAGVHGDSSNVGEQFGSELRVTLDLSQSDKILALFTFDQLLTID